MSTELSLSEAGLEEKSAAGARELRRAAPALNVTVLVDSIAANYGGPSYSVRRLWQSAQKLGASVTVHSTDSFAARESDADRRLWQPLDCRQWPAVGMRALGYSNRMAKGVAETIVNGSSVISQHGLWLHYGRVARNLGRRRNVPVIIHPHGMLEPWALRRSSWKKQLTGRLWEYENLRRAACLRVTSESELRAVRSFGLKNPLALIPNGIDVEDYSGLPTSTEAEALLPELEGKRVLLFLSRVHPKKGLAMLLNAWHALQTERRDWLLLIAGPGQGGHPDELKQLVDDLKLSRSVVFAGALFGQEKLAALARASLFILPSHSENFGIAIAEALAAGLPVVTTRGTPWKGLEEKNCGWWTEGTVEKLADALRAALSLSDVELKRMGAKGRQWMARDFSWAQLASQMMDVCRWTIDGGPAPVCVALD